MGALRRDISNASFEEIIIDKHSPMVDIISTKGEQRNTYWVRDSYSSTISWLKKKGYYEQCILQPEEVNSAILEKIMHNSRVFEKNRN